MKQGKTAGPSGVISEMLKAAGEEGLEKSRLLAELVFSSGEIPKDWEESLILNLYKGKGDALDRGNYRGLKLNDQVMIEVTWASTRLLHPQDGKYRQHAVWICPW